MSPDLKIGTITALFSAEGKTPWASDWENITFKAGASISEQLINREDGKPSGPAELEESSLMDSTIMDSENSMSDR